MPKRRNKKTKRKCNSNKTYTFDVNIDNNHIPELQNFMSDIIQKHNEKFVDCNLDNKTNHDRISLLSDRYMFYYGYLEAIGPLLHLDNDLVIAKNNYICLLFNTVRDIAKKYNLEKELSQHITKLHSCQFHTILDKYNKDVFQYVDEMEALQKMHSNLKLIQNASIYEYTHPKIIIKTYDKFSDLKNLAISFLLEYNNEEAFELACYVKLFDALFPSELCIDLQKLWYLNDNTN